MKKIPFLLTAALIALPAEAVSAPDARLVPPVDAPVSRSFQAPEVSWGPGHRGIDYAVAAGTAVRSAGAGTVTFAGNAAGVLAVTIDHGMGLETTYSNLSELLVEEGRRVVAGVWIGRAGAAHVGSSDGLHFGVRLDGGYVDPSSLLVDLDSSAALSLLPVIPKPAERAVEKRFGRDLPLGILAGGCREPGQLEIAASPPNDNVAVAIAGIGSHTAGGISADMYEHGPEFLGYPRGRVKRFSYRGISGPRLHEPYSKEDTFQDPLSAARLLRALMKEIAVAFPGKGVDLIAHSQGGVVARAYLQLVADRFDRTLPRVEHLVTFSSPHEGAPLAGAARGLREDSLLGGPALDLISSATEVLPPSDSEAVAQLAPGSELMDALAQQDIPFGTRALTISIPNDVVVPADRTDVSGADDVVIPPEGLNGHSAVVSSRRARAIAYSFLAGGSAACPGFWDDWGPRVGTLISAVESSLPGLVRRWESRAFGAAGSLADRI